MMDVSEQYMKMCKEAEEIQKIWELEDGDFYINPQKHLKVKAYGYWHHSRTAFEAWKQKRNIWLPRQDQLQTIVMDDDAFFWVLEEFHSFVFEIYGPYCVDNFDSPEQLWLAYVMESKYGKLWDGKEWVKKGEGE